MDRYQAGEIVAMIFDLLIFATILFFGILYLLKNFIQKRNSIIDAYKYAAKELGLVYSKSKILISSIKLTGILKDCPTDISLLKEKRVECINVKINVDLSHLGEFQIIPETKFSLMQQKIGSKDAQCYDNRFDNTFHIIAKNNERLISALNFRVRQYFHSLCEVSTGFEISHEGMNISLPIQQVGHAPVQYIRDIVHTAILLQEQDFKKRLINNSLFDVHTKFREYNLGILVNAFPKDKDTIATLEKALQDRSQNIQIFAAKLLEVEGKAVLLDLIKSRKVTAKNLPEILDHFQKSGYKKCVPALMDYYKDCTTLEGQIAIMNTLSVLGEKSSQEFLLEYLKQDSHDLLQMAIIHSLGVCGGMEALEALFRLKETIKDTQIKNVINSSIALIQEREGVQGEKGWLSLNETTETEGGLSLSDSEQGGLSMVEEE